MKKITLVFLVTLFSFILMLSYGDAQNFWHQTNSPVGGWVRVLAVSPNGSIFAGTETGIFRSTDNGDNWVLINDELANDRIYAIVINSSGHIFAGTNNGVFRSTDNGNSWILTNSGLTSTYVSSLAINDSGYVFAGTDHGGIFRSKDNGNSWTAISKGLPDVQTGAIRPLAISVNGHIFAEVVNQWGACVGIFRSTDNGDNWVLINDELANDMIYVIVINSIGYIFAGTNRGVFRSTDGGDSWTWANRGLTNLYVVSLAISPGGHVFAGTYDGGIFRSTDNGDNWTIVNSGLTETPVMSLAINSDEHLFAGMLYGGVFRSTDNGDTWEVANTGLTNIPIYSLAINSNGYIYARTGLNGIFRSVDNGDNWTCLNTEFTDIDFHPYFKVLAISACGHIFAGLDMCFVHGNGIGIAYLGRLYRSTNNGDSWKQTSSLPWADMASSISALAISDSGYIYAGTVEGIFRSTNNGGSWTVVRKESFLGINTLTINLNGHVFAAIRDIYTGFGVGIIRSTDNGDSWTAVNSGLTSLNIASLTTSPSEYVFAGTDSGGIFRSADNGDSWTDLQTNNMFLSAVNTITISTSGHIFVGTSDNGVFHSSDNGDTWIALNTGMTCNHVNSIVIAPNQHIFAGTSGGGVFRSIQPITDVKEYVTEMPTSFLLEQNYPNPFNNSTIINYQLPMTGEVDLSVYNILRQKVATLVAEEQQAGSYKVEWDASGFASGIYLYKIEAGEYVEVQKMILLK